MTTATRQQPISDADFQAAIEGTRTTNGTPLSALVSAGLGVFALGLFTTLAEASASFANSLKLVTQRDRCRARRRTRSSSGSSLGR